MSISIHQIKKSEEQAARDLIISVLENEFSKDSNAYSQNDLDHIKKSYGDDRETFLVAYKDDQLIGTTGLKEDSVTTALLRRVFVHPNFRGNGYGMKLIESAIAFAKEQRYKKIIFSGTSKMIGALNLCRKKGFEEEAKINMGDIIIYRYELEI